MKEYGYKNVRGVILNYSGRYIKIGNGFFRSDQWEILLAILFLLLVIVILVLYRDDQPQKGLYSYVYAILKSIMLRGDLWTRK
jgi:hypothetical protein